MAGQVRYIYQCSACGNTGEVDFPDGSHEGTLVTCPASCGERATLDRDHSSLFWPEGGAGFLLWQVQAPGDADPLARLSLSIDADRWLKRGKLDPKEAALALCGCNPDDARAVDPLARVDAPLKDDCERLSDHFKKIEKADRRVHRTLADWWGIARTGDFGYHAHFDELMQTFSIGQPNSKATSTGPAKPILVSQQQEDKILQAIAELGYTARSLPKNRPGISGVKAKIRTHLVRSLTSSAFRKAWDRLRDSKRIAYVGGNDPLVREVL